MLPVQANTAQMRELHVRSIPLDIILTIFTCGLWSLRVQYKQMQAINFMIGEQKYSFWVWFLLSIITFGIYHYYHEYRKSSDIAIALNKPQSNEPLIHLIVALFSFGIIADALQQVEINKFFGDNAL